MHRAYLIFMNLKNLATWIKLLSCIKNRMGSNKHNLRMIVPNKIQWITPILQLNLSETKLFCIKLFLQRKMENGLYPHHVF